MGVFALIAPAGATGVSLWKRIVLFSVVVCAGAVGGAAFFGTGRWRTRGGAYRTLANVTTLFAGFGVIVALFVVVIWLAW